MRQDAGRDTAIENGDRVIAIEESVYQAWSEVSGATNDQDFHVRRISSGPMIARDRQSDPWDLQCQQKDAPSRAIHPSCATFLPACWHVKRAQDKRRLIPPHPYWPRDTRVSIHR